MPLSFIGVEKDSYISAMLAIYELNEVNPLAKVYFDSYLRTCDLYEATTEALGFDEVRVRYRQQRRELIRHIIINLLNGNAIDDYLREQAKLLVQKDEIVRFIEDINEDLAEINPQRIVGMAITERQLNDWLSKK